MTALGKYPDTQGGYLVTTPNLDDPFSMHVASSQRFWGGFERQVSLPLAELIFPLLIRPDEIYVPMD